MITSTIYFIQSQIPHQSLEQRPGREERGAEKSFVCADFDLTTVHGINELTATLD